MHLEGFGQIPPQGGLQDDWTATAERYWREVGVFSSGGDGGGDGVTGGGDLLLPPPEHSCTVYCEQAHYGLVSCGGEASGVTVVQVVVSSGRNGLGGDMDGGS